MKNLTAGISVFLLLHTSHLQAQTKSDLRSAYIDAKAFARIKASAKSPIALSEDVTTALQFYCGKDTKITAAYLEKNPFLKGVFSDPVSNNGGAAGGGDGSEEESRQVLGISFDASTNLATPDGTGADVTRVAQGIAVFMIQRAKEELTVTFFDRLKTFFENNPEISILFPKTTYSLDNLLTYHYPEMLPTLRKAFYDDLGQLAIHFDNVLKLPKYKQLLAKFPEVRLAIHSIMIVQSIANKDTHPYEMLDQLAMLPDWTDDLASDELKKVGGAIKLTNLISQSLLVDDSAKTNVRWATMTEVNSLVMDTTAFKIYLGLLFEQINTDPLIPNFIAGTTHQALPNVMSAVDSTYKRWNNMLMETTQLTQKVNLLLKNVTNGNFTAADAYSYISSTLDIIEFAFTLPSNFNYSPSARVNNIINLLRCGDNLYRDIYRENYPGAIGDVVTLYTGINGLKHSAIVRVAQFAGSATAFKATKNTFLEIAQSAATNSNVEISDRQFRKLRNGYDSLRRGIQLLGRMVASINSGNVSAVCEAIVKRDPSMSYLTDQARTVIGTKQTASNRNDMYQQLSTLINQGKILNDITILYAGSRSNPSQQAEVEQVLALLGSDLQGLDDVLSGLSKYGTFIANLASAQNENDVANILEQAVLPVGSSSIKKHSKFNLSVQSYLGATFWSKTSATTALHQPLWASPISVTAPIGISASVGLPRRWGSFTFFTSLIDLGAIVSLQQKDSSATNPSKKVTTNYKINLGQVFSPGFYVVYGIGGDLPLSIGIGRQYGPGLSSASSPGQGYVVTNNPDWRWTAFLAVDIPFFNLMNIDQNKIRR